MYSMMGALKEKRQIAPENNGGKYLTRFFFGGEGGDKFHIT